MKQLDWTQPRPLPPKRRARRVRTEQEKALDRAIKLGAVIDLGAVIREARTEAPRGDREFQRAAHAWFHRGSAPC